MKNIILVLCILFTGTSYGQIQSVSLQASGLTCSMCSRAIYKALQKVPDVSDVQEDIEHTSYHIRFSDPAAVSLESLKKAVKNAGFSVASMEVKVHFDQESVASDTIVRLSSQQFQFVHVSHQNLNGVKSLLVLDKDYLLEKERKKYSGSYESVPASDGAGRIFHVTISKS
jgi:copper chaperone CopZ